LEGWSLNDYQTKTALTNYARGFPIPVLCNGSPLPRPDAIDMMRSWMETEIGTVSIHDIETSLSAGARALGVKNVQVYLQGLPISIGTGYPDASHNVVHLDSRRFTGRMPDRSALVDEDAAKHQVSTAVKTAWQIRLRRLKAELSAEDFAALAYPTALMWGCLELFDDVDDLPPQVLSIADTYPMHRCEWEDGNSAYRAPPVSRRHIVAGLVKIVTLDEEDDTGERDGRSWKAEMYAYLHKAVLFDGGLPQSHWIHGVVTDLTANQVTVALNRPEPVASFIGNTLWQVPVVVCDSYTLDGPLGPVQGYVPWYGRVATSEEDPVILYEGDPVIVYPRQSQRTEVVRQVDAFWDGDSERFLDTEEEQEEARLLGFIRSRFHGEHAEVLRMLLSDLDMRSYPGLHGGRFEVQIGLPDGDGRPTITVKPIDNPE
jgi:hypothetical protein